MGKIIEEYYRKAKVTPFLLRQKLTKFERNKDILNEFEYWINNKSYMKGQCIEIENYTAEKLSKLSKYLEGEGSFLLLIELRENPKRALKKIESGFKYR